MGSPFGWIGRSVAATRYCRLRGKGMQPDLGWRASTISTATSALDKVEARIDFRTTAKNTVVPQPESSRFQECTEFQSYGTICPQNPRPTCKPRTVRGRDSSRSIEKRL